MDSFSSVAACSYSTSSLILGSGQGAVLARSVKQRTKRGVREQSVERHSHKHKNGQTARDKIGEVCSSLVHDRARLEAVSLEVLKRRDRGAVAKERPVAPRARKGEGGVGLVLRELAVACADARRHPGA